VKIKLFLLIYFLKKKKKKKKKKKLTREDASKRTKDLELGAWRCCGV